jgi:hypothetical protein
MPHNARQETTMRPYLAAAALVLFTLTAIHCSRPTYHRGTSIHLHLGR